MFKTIQNLNLPNILVGSEGVCHNGSRKRSGYVILKKHGNRMAAKESITPYCNQSTGVLVTAPFISIDQSLERTWARSLTVKTDLKPMPLPQELKNSVHKASLAVKHVNSAQVLQQKNNKWTKKVSRCNAHNLNIISSARLDPPNSCPRCSQWILLQPLEEASSSKTQRYHKGL